MHELPNTAPAEVLQALMQYEPIFHRPAFGATREAFARWLAPEFCEVGASGRCYARDEVLDILAQRHAQPDPVPEVWRAHDFRCCAVAPDLYLLTYTLVQAESRVTRRATLWRRGVVDWQIVYHQGTLVASVEA